MIKRDVWGKKIPKKEIKREVIAENRARGKRAEERFEMNARFSGYEVERTGRGSDYKIRKRDPWTRKVVYTGYREIKSGNAQLSDLQKKTKKRKSNYKVIREDNNWLF
ncbi:MAG: hypothetical protein QHH19_04410 [Candidatus Thermoplasmatota archaeon]|jgi:hypothetical protein|nr:hypothetical protein [Candidatus Thermoplasmatota archaeon]